MIREFFSFVKGVHPTEVTPVHLLSFREHLQVKKMRRARTVSFKLTVIRSFLEYLKAGGVVIHNSYKTWSGKRGGTQPKLVL